MMYHPSKGFFRFPIELLIDTFLLPAEIFSLHASKQGSQADREYSGRNGIMSNAKA
jgi:hypothetical protein